MEKTKALDELKILGQEHILNNVSHLTIDQQNELYKQIESIDIPTFQIQQRMLLSPQHFSINSIEPYNNFAVAGSHKDFNTGKELIAAGKVGCLVVAGGQGTRLRLEGPKGMFPVSLIKNKSLFQLLAEKVAAAGKQAGRILPLAVLTSPLNHVETVAFFRKHSLFGLEEKQISFFSQSMLPMLTEKGDLFLEERDRIAMGPDGNGSSLNHFWTKGLWEEWFKRGVSYLNYILIDNPLADPFDAELIGHHHNSGSQVTVKCTPRKDPSEKEGILVIHENKVKVIEYSELPENEKHSRNNDGSLKHVCANLSFFVFQMDFIKKAIKQEIPLHMAHKAVKMLLPDGRSIQPSEPNAWKFEKFIFDVLPLAERVGALLYPRDMCFAPLKNSNGANSLETVRAALLARDKQVFFEITGRTPPSFPFELSQDFYYPTPELLQKWKTEEFPPTNYIEP